MTRSQKYKRRSLTPSRFWGNRYARIVGIILIVVTVASFYIYQRVWVRNLVGEIEVIQGQNEKAELHLSAVKSEWIARSSITKIEEAIDRLRLDLEPTRPSQNFMLRPHSDRERSRYAGLMKAFENLKGSIPLVSSNEADASELFDEK